MAQHGELRGLVRKLTTNEQLIRGFGGLCRVRRGFFVSHAYKLSPLAIASSSCGRYPLAVDTHGGWLLGRAVGAAELQVDASLLRDIEAAHTNWRAAQLPMHARVRVLDELRAALREDADALADCISQEARKPIALARLEVQRAVETCAQTVLAAAQVSAGACLDPGLSSQSAGMFAWTQRRAVGPALLITPFNFPLNLAMHKVCASLLAGVPWLLKPSPRTPGVAQRLGACVARTSLPAEQWSVADLPHTALEPLLAHFPLLSFTGSSEVGWSLRGRFPQHRMLLELGGVAPAAVFADTPVDDVALAQRLMASATGYAGQSCISLQRVLVERSRYAALHEALSAARAAVRPGVLDDPATLLGPMIDAEATARTLERLRQSGAHCEGGTRLAADTLEPALLTELAPDASLHRQELFAPVLSLEPFDDEAELAPRLNAGPYGLQASVFTADFARARRLAVQLDYGAVLHNEVPSWRADAWPYGGVKASGLGREGASAAYAFMTEPQLVVSRA